MSNVAAIYHFTNGSEKRPIVNQKQLNMLAQFAIDKGYSVGEIFCDKSLLKSEHYEFERFMSEADKFDVLVVKDFYHLSKNTMKCMTIMKELKSKGIQVQTLNNGNFSWEEAPFDKPLRVATYCCRFGKANEIRQLIPIQNDILKLFVNKKTQWSVVDQYFDESEHQNDGEQKQLMQLINNKDRYDIILVHNLNDVHWRTSNFCKIREQLHLNIYSLQEGFLKYDKGDD